MNTQTQPERWEWWYVASIVLRVLLVFVFLKALLNG